MKQAYFYCFKEYLKEGRERMGSGIVHVNSEDMKNPEIVLESLREAAKSKVESVANDFVIVSFNEI